MTALVIALAWIVGSIPLAMFLGALLHRAQPISSANACAEEVTGSSAGEQPATSLVAVLPHRGGGEFSTPTPSERAGCQRPTRSDDHQRSSLMNDTEGVNPHTIKFPRNVTAQCRCGWRYTSHAPERGEAIKQAVAAAERHSFLNSGEVWLGNVPMVGSS